MRLPRPLNSLQAGNLRHCGTPLQQDQADLGSGSLSSAQDAPALGRAPEAVVGPAGDSELAAAPASYLSEGRCRPPSLDGDEFNAADAWFSNSSGDGRAKREALALAEQLAAAIAQVFEAHLAGRRSQAASETVRQTQESASLRHQLAEAQRQLVQMQLQLGQAHTELGHAQLQLADATARSPGLAIAPLAAAPLAAAPLATPSLTVAPVTFAPRMAEPLTAAPPAELAKPRTRAVRRSSTPSAACEERGWRAEQRRRLRPVPPRGSRAPAAQRPGMAQPHACGLAGQALAWAAGGEDSDGDIVGTAVAPRAARFLLTAMFIVVAAVGVAVMLES